MAVVSNVMPNWLCIFLLTLSVLSFLPQLLLLVRHQHDISGINLYYVLLNLVVATELFTLCFFYVVSQIEDADFFAHKPPTTGDWLNLVQVTAAWILWGGIFILYILFSPRSSRGLVKTVAAEYIGFLLISVVPVVLDAVTHRFNWMSSSFSHPSYDNDRRWFGALFHGAHTLFLAPAITALAAACLPFQAREILSRPGGTGTGAFSVVGCAAQALIFVVLAATWWPGRLVFPTLSTNPRAQGHLPFRPWYQLVGFLPVDHAVFAVVQGLLFLVAFWHRRRELLRGHVSEREPLWANGSDTIRIGAGI